jgi:acetyl-CoA C-acetyltransferase
MSIWILPGLRTIFTKSDGPLQSMDAIALSVPVVQAMMAQLERGTPDLVVWGTVVPNLTWSNIAREVTLDAGVGSAVPAFSTVMACSTSMIGAIQAASMLDNRSRSLAIAGGAESLSHIQVGLTNRSTGKSMGEHMEMTIRQLAGPSREAQDRLSLESHRSAVAAQERGFFDDLTIPIAGVVRDTIPRRDTSMEKLAKLPPVFDRSKNGSITAGNSSPLTDGAAGMWLATDSGLSRLPSSMPRVRLVDWEIVAVDIHEEGLLMGPAYAIPRLLERNNLKYSDVQLWEIHEAFAAQVLAHLQLLEDRTFLSNRAGVTSVLGAFPRERVNPNGGSIALGHPFGATGARIMSQAAKELALTGAGARAIVSVCADGGEGTVALLEAA